VPVYCILAKENRGAVSVGGAEPFDGFAPKPYCPIIAGKIVKGRASID
jgi:hypothetical protein